MYYTFICLQALSIWNIMLGSVNFEILGKNNNNKKQQLLAVFLTK